MINVQKELEARLGEKVIFVTSYDDGKVTFTVIPEEGKAYLTCVALEDLGRPLHVNVLSEAANDLLQQILKARKYEKAKLDKRNAERIIKAFETSC